MMVEASGFGAWAPSGLSRLSGVKTSVVEATSELARLAWEDGYVGAR